MMRINDQRSIVGIDPTSRGIAFASFENGELLDWGNRQSDGNELRLMDRLFDAFKAETLVLEDGDAPRSERRPRVRRLLRRLRGHAESRGIAVIPVSRYDVRAQWAKRGLTRKHAVAAAIGGMFPELEVLVPSRRKVYRSEEARTEIFDAISLVLHAFPAEEMKSNSASARFAV